jgi:hypothetical protein
MRLADLVGLVNINCLKSVTIGHRPNVRALPGFEDHMPMMVVVLWDRIVRLATGTIKFVATTNPTSLASLVDLVVLASYKAPETYLPLGW